MDAREKALREIVSRSVYLARTKAGITQQEYKTTARDPIHDWP